MLIAVADADSVGSMWVAVWPLLLFPLQLWMIEMTDGGKKVGDIYVFINLYWKKAQKILALLELINRHKHKIRFVFSLEIQEAAA